VKQIVTGAARVERGRVSVTIDLPITPDAPPAEALPTVEPGGAAAASPEPQHSRDFASVKARGKLYTFTRTQRLIVAHLWEAWENDTPFVGQRTLLSEADCSGLRLRDVFRGNPAYGELIVAGPERGGPVGTYCLAMD